MLSLTTIPNHEYKTRLIIRGIDHSLWYFGDISSLYSPGDQVSIIYERSIQSWIFRINHDLIYIDHAILLSLLLIILENI